MFFDANSRFSKPITVTIFVALTACNGGMFSGSGLTGKKSKSKTSDALVGSTADTGIGDVASSEAVLEASFDELQNVSMSDYIAAARARMSNDVVEVEGQTFFDLKDFTDRHEDLYQNISDQYQTVGEYFEALGISGNADILPENVEKGYAQLGEAFSTGKIEEILSDSKFAEEKSDASQATDTESKNPKESIGLLKQVIPMALLIPSPRSNALRLLEEAQLPVAASAAATSVPASMHEASKYDSEDLFTGGGMGEGTTKD